MLGLAFLFVFIIYLLISLGVIAYAVRKAKERGIDGWKWGVPAAFVMYLIVFWDHIPTLIAHKYYCDKEAGFFVYKTLEEWKEENPGVAETLTYQEISNSEKHGNNYVYHLNERFDWLIDNETLFLTVKRSNNKLIDVLKDEVLAEYTDFSSGYGTPMTGYGGWGKIKMWLMNNSCEKDVRSRKKFYEFEASAEKLGEEL